MTPLQFLVGLLAALVQVSLRRIFRGRRRPSWSIVQEALVDVMRTHGRLLQNMPPQEARRLGDRLQTVNASTPGVEVRRETLAERPARRFVPIAPAPVKARILYLHGGGYVAGSSDSYRGHLARLAVATGCEVLAPDYRLAPEDPYPAALEDSCACMQAALHAEDGPWFVCGDSAGGGLALAAAQRAVARGTLAPVGLVLLSPWVDLGASGGSVEDNAAFDWGDRRYLDNYAAQYLRDTPPSDAGASPLHGELRGLPPILLAFGDAELLRDQNRALARRAEAAGVAVTSQEDADMVHGYWMMPPTFPAAAVLERVAVWIDAELRRAPPSLDGSDAGR